MNAEKESRGFPIGEILIGGTPIAEFNICYDRVFDASFGQDAKKTATMTPAQKESYIRTVRTVSARAAAELQKYICYACGVTVPILRGMWGKSGHEFIVGPCVKNPKVPTLRADGIYYEVEGGNVHLCGEGTRGTLYAVYAFLEEQLGWRFFTPDLERVKPCEALQVPEGAHKVYSPPFVFRQTCWGMTIDNPYAVKRKLNVQSGEYSGIFLPRNCGFGITYVKGLGCHTFDDFMLKREYPEHPEYFADIKGENPQGDETPPPDGQEELCLTNPDVLSIVTQKVGEWLAAEENPTLISISQNDNANGYCRCKNCVKEGTVTDNYLKFVIKIANHFKKQYPNVVFEMLAYHYTQSPPSAGIKIPANVGARLCSIKACGAHAFDDTSCAGQGGERSANQIFAEDLRGWNRVCKNVSVWDYSTNFAYYLSPFPNFEVLRRNAAFHKRMGTKRLFIQGNGGRSGEFGELRGYLAAKLLWEPAMSKKAYCKAMDEFLAAYYGAGWRSVRAYIDLLTQKANTENHYSYYTNPVGIQNQAGGKKIVSASDTAFLEEALALWEKALKKAKTDEEKEHVGRSRLSIRFYELCATFERELQNGTKEAQEMWREKNRHFQEDVLRARVGLSEGVGFPVFYKEDMPPSTWTGRPL